MARRRISLGQFRVSNDGDYGGGSNLDHHYRRCDWQLGIDQLTPPEITRLAREHARECDGLPQPVKPRQPDALASATMALWAPVIEAALKPVPLLFNERGRDVLSA